MSRRDEKAGAKRALAGVKARLDRALDAMESPAGDSKVLPVGALRGMLAFLGAGGEPPGSDPEHERAPRRAVRARRARGAGLRHRGPQLRGGDRVPHGRAHRAVHHDAGLLLLPHERLQPHHRRRGTSKVFDASSCLQGRNETAEELRRAPGGDVRRHEGGHLPVPHRGLRQAKQHWAAEPDSAIVPRPTALPHFKNTEVTGAHAPSVCATLKEAKFSCVTRDFDADAGAGHEWSDFTPTYCPSEEDTGTSRCATCTPSLCTPVLWVPRRELRVPNRGLRRRRRRRQADVERL